VVFSSEYTHELTEIDFKYEGFDLMLVDIFGYEPTALDVNTAEVLLAGMLHFEDDIGRKASTYFTVRYSVTKNKILIEASDVVAVPPVFPRLEAYFVPQSAFANLQEGDLSNFTDLYLYSSLSAEPMVASDEERKAREAYEKMSLWKKVAAGAKGQEDYFIIVFCMDRLASGSELKMTLSDSMGTLGQELAEVVYRYDAGWRTMIAGGKFNPDSPSTHFYANVTYTLDPRGGTEPLLIGSFKNEKDYSPLQTPKMLAQQPGDPIANGAVFLNPDTPQDASQIQNRLRQLGYFQGPVDGKFGAQSKDALSRFVAAAGVEGDGIWTLEVQKKLFAKQAALNSGPISTGDKLLDPRHRSDARLIQSRLKELGFYGGKIDGLFGKGSYRALENYSLSAGIPGSGRWNLDVQRALFKGTGQ
jgi:peptidoglycan hydrolase-like protein with peptidoglycan-binding domain